MMRRLLVLILLVIGPVSAVADGKSIPFQEIVEQDILPGFAELNQKTAIMADETESSCNAADLRRKYIEAFRAWARVSHLRFGPSEQENRAFALAFWPDPRGKTPKALRKLLLNPDPDALTPEAYEQVSIAARGFYALDYLLFDPEIATLGTPDQRCALVRAVARDIHATAQDLDLAWHGYAPVLTAPGPDAPYRSGDEVLQVLYKSASTGLQFTADMRFGRPLGTFEKPRPKRAEAWRSGQSLALIRQAVAGSGGLALRLAADDPVLASRLDYALTRFDQSAAELGDPTLAGVSTPQGRIRVEALLNDLNAIRRIVDQDLGAHLGVIAGFNALDGD